MNRYLILSALALFGCSTEPEVSARLEVTQAEIAASRISPPLGGAPETLRFIIPYRVENFGSEPLMFHGCPSGRVEVVTSQGWRPAWNGHQICLAIFAPITVPPGESRDLELQVSASIGGADPDWQVDGIAGTYRYTLAVFEPEQSRLTSNTFRLIEQ